MVEALKHISDYSNFKNSCIECKKNVKYKKIVSDEAINDLIDFTSYNDTIWRNLIILHLKKMNYLCIDEFELPNQLFNQLEIFYNQIEKYISPHNKVTILSAFPIFLFTIITEMKILCQK